MHTTTLLGRGRLNVSLAGLALGFVFCVSHTRADEPNPKLKPRHGSVELKHGFTPDPFTKNLSAGGTIKTELGGVKALVGQAPDVKFHYTAEVRLDGSLPTPLRFYVEAKHDTTLLVKLPDGTWVANDDGAGNKNPQLRFGRPQSGWYTIWVGTFGHEKTPVNGVAATLHISETSAAPKSAAPKTAVPKTAVPKSASLGARLVRLQQEINAFRAEHGLPALASKNQLISVARDYAKVMATMDKMGHSVDGTTVAQRLDKGGYKYSRYFENVAWNMSNADPAAQAFKSWQESTTGHREAMLSRDVTEIGIGVGTSSTGKYYFCLVLAKPR